MAVTEPEIHSVHLSAFWLAELPTLFPRVPHTPWLVPCQSARLIPPSPSRSDGTTHLLLSPLELIEKLAALIPPPRLNLVRYHGILAPHAHDRHQVVPDPPSPTVSPAPGDSLAPPRRPHRPPLGGAIGSLFMWWTVRGRFYPSLSYPLNAISISWNVAIAQPVAIGNRGLAPTTPGPLVAAPTIGGPIFGTAASSPASARGTSSRLPMMAELGNDEFDVPIEQTKGVSCSSDFAPIRIATASGRWK